MFMFIFTNCVFECSVSAAVNYTDKTDVTLERNPSAF